jgi:hypothetical protein
MPAVSLAPFCFSQNSEKCKAPVLRKDEIWNKVAGGWKCEKATK